MRIAFEDDQVQVIHAPGASAHVIVTFDTMGRLANGKRFWGDVLPARYATECYGVVAKRNNWYPAPSMRAVAGLLAPLRGSRVLIGYGHSMGGYACLKYAALLGLAGSVASGPQLTIDPEGPVADQRYTHHFDPARHAGMQIMPEDLGARHVVVYDPGLKEDRLHAEAILALSPRVVAIRLPYVNHRATVGLRPSTVLLPLFDAIAEGTLAERLPALSRAARAAKKTHPQYLVYLARAAIKAGKPRAALGILRRMEAEPDRRLAMERHLYAARACRALGRAAEAAANYEALLALAPAHPHAARELDQLRRAGSVQASRPAARPGRPAGGPLAGRPA